MDEALKYHWVLGKGEARGTALKDVKNLSRHGVGDVRDVPSMQSSEVGVSRTHSLRDIGRPPSSKAGSLMGRSGEQAGEREQGPGWGVICGSPPHCSVWSSRPRRWVRGCRRLSWWVRKGVRGAEYPCWPSQYAVTRKPLETLLAGPR